MPAAFAEDFRVVFEKVMLETVSFVFGEEPRLLTLSPWLPLQIVLCAWMLEVEGLGVMAMHSSAMTVLVRWALQREGEGRKSL